MGNLIRTGLLPDLRPTLTRLGADPDRVIAAAGLDPELLEKPDTFIPYRKYRALLVEAVAATGCERFGLELAANLGAQSLGVVGFALQQAETVGDAYRTLANFLHLHEQHGRVVVDDLGRYTRVRYVIDDLHLPGAAQGVDVAAAIGHNILVALLGKDVAPVRVEIPYPRPADLSPYRFLNCQSLVFNAADYGFVMETRRMDSPIPNRDPRMGEMLAQYMQELDARSSPSKTDKVERMVTDLLSTGDCTLERVAEFFGVTSRTLQNWLQQEGTSFHTIIENVRRELATQYLNTEGMRLTNIALLLGYTDSSSFTRSFRRWYGQSPSQWRKGHATALAGS